MAVFFLPFLGVRAGFSLQYRLYFLQMPVALPAFAVASKTSRIFQKVLHFISAAILNAAIVSQKSLFIKIGNLRPLEVPSF